MLNKNDTLNLTCERLGAELEGVCRTRARPFSCPARLEHLRLEGFSRRAGLTRTQK